MPPPPSALPPSSGRTFAWFSEATTFLWSIADLLRGDDKQADDGKVILPVTALRRLGCVLEPTKAGGAGHGEEGALGPRGQGHLQEPHVPDARIDESKTKAGNELPFTRHFDEYKPLRPLGEIEKESRQREEEIRGKLGEVLG